MGQRGFAGTNVSLYSNEMIIHDMNTAALAVKGQSKLNAAIANGTFINCGKIIPIPTRLNHRDNLSKVVVLFCAIPDA